jgi:hypothetical protein
VEQTFYAIGAGAALVVHLLWLLFVIFGALITNGRPVLTWLHWAALIWGFVVEAGPWPCPLTGLEQHLQTKAGITPYEGAFIVHYLDRLVYPDIPPWVLIAGAVLVCGVNLWVYVRRFRNRPRWSGSRL